jgi:hypothetical protein
MRRAVLVLAAAALVGKVLITGYGFPDRGAELDDDCNDLMVW